MTCSTRLLFSINKSYRPQCDFIYSFHSSNSIRFARRNLSIPTLQSIPISSSGFPFTQTLVYPKTSKGFINRKPRLYSNKVFSAMPSQISPPQDYRANVGLILVNNDKLVFIASRIDSPEAWQMPQGGIDGKETPKEAAIRELKEETGVTSAEVIGEVPEWLCYDFPPDVREKITKLWGYPWKGQAQKWLLLKFNGSDSEIKLFDENGTEKAEFSEWKWATVEQAIDAAVPFKKTVYEKAFDYFRPMIEKM